MTDAPSGTNYPSNSKKKKEEVEQKREPRVAKTISSEVVERKKPLGKRFMAAFTGDDSRTVGQYVLFEVVLPAAKQLISDVVTQATERFLFGDSGGRRSSRPGYTAYNRMSSTQNRREEPRVLSQRARATHNFDEIVLPDRRDAERVLEDLIACVDEYDVATVSDLYDLVGITGSFQDDKWGWYDLRDSRVKRVREGYLLDLPRTQPIE